MGWDPRLVQGRWDDQRELLDVESLAGHLIKPGSVFGFLAAHRSRLFPPELFSDLFPTRRGRPSVPGEVIATVLVLQALQGLSDREAVEALTPVIRGAAEWIFKAAFRYGLGAGPRMGVRG